MSDFRTETINAVKSMGITAKELGFGDADALEMICVAKSRQFDTLTTAIAKLIKELDAEETAREIVPEEFWEDLGITENKYKIVEVQLRKTLYKTVNIVMGNDEDKYNADDYIDVREIDDGDADDWDDWEVTYTEELDSDLTRSEAEMKDFENDIDDVDF